MSRFRLRLLTSLLIVLALILAGVAHAPMAAARIAAGTAVVAAASALPACHERGEQHGNEQHRVPAKSHQTPDCCLLFCTSLPAAMATATRPIEYAIAGFMPTGAVTLIPRTLSPEPGPPRA